MPSPRPYLLISGDITYLYLFITYIIQQLIQGIEFCKMLYHLVTHHLALQQLLCWRHPRVATWDPWDPNRILRFAAEPEPAKPMNFKIKELTEEDWADWADWADNLRKVIEKCGKMVVSCGTCGTSKWMVVSMV